nr:hypothetical protein [Fodinicola feengrottensis]
MALKNAVDPQGRSAAELMIAEAKKALWVMVGLLALMWVVQLFNSVDSYRLSQDLGITSRDIGSLPEIVTAPFLHASWAHIEGKLRTAVHLRLPRRVPRSEEIPRRHRADHRRQRVGHLAHRPVVRDHRRRQRAGFWLFRLYHGSRHF